MKCGSWEQLDTEPTPPGELLKALDYFIIPDTLWPVGLVVMAAICQGYDANAHHIMATIKSDYLSLAQEDKQWHEYNTRRIYHIGKDYSEHGFGIREESLFTFFDYQNLSSINKRIYNMMSVYSSIPPKSTPSPLPEPLKERLQRLADAEFLRITFNPEEKANLCPYTKTPIRPWSFTTHVDIP